MPKLHAPAGRAAPGSSGRSRCQWARSNFPLALTPPEITCGKPSCMTERETYALLEKAWQAGGVLLAETYDRGKMRGVGIDVLIVSKPGAEETQFSVGGLPDSRPMTAVELHALSDAIQRAMTRVDQWRRYLGVRDAWGMEAPE